MALFLLNGDTLQVVTSGTPEIDVHVSFVDNNAGAITPGRTNTPHIASATTTTIMAGPSSGVTRNLIVAWIHNSDASASNTVTVQHTDGTTVENLYKYTLLAGESLILKESGDPIVIDANGGIKNFPGTGRLLKVTTLTSGTTFTTGAGTNSIKVRLWGGGAAGGGGASTASNAAVGGGGGAGARAEKFFAVTPNTAYTYAIGAGGTAGSTGNNPGNAGGNTTFAVSGVTVTAPGGNGGAGMAAAVTAGTSSAGGAASTQASNGDLNGVGASGDDGYRTSGTVGVSGKGADSDVGGGGLAVVAEGTGNAGTGFAAGGSGGACLNGGTAVAGGAGAPGLIIVEEYA